MIADSWLYMFFLSPAHHTVRRFVSVYVRVSLTPLPCPQLHHLFFTVNYGQVRLVPLPIQAAVAPSLTHRRPSVPQYFAFSDRMGGSLKEPAAEYDPMNAVHQIIQKEKAQKAAPKKVD